MEKEQEDQSRMSTRANAAGRSTAERNGEAPQDAERTERIIPREVKLAALRNRADLWLHNYNYSKRDSHAEDSAEATLIHQLLQMLPPALSSPVTERTTDEIHAVDPAVQAQHAPSTRDDLLSEISSLRTDLASLKAEHERLRPFNHWCQDGHEQIVCKDDGSEMCPVCKVVARLEFEQEKHSQTLQVWREQDEILQQIASVVGDEHVTCAADVLTVTKAELETLRAKLVALKAELQNKKDQEVHTRMLKPEMSAAQPTAERNEENPRAAKRSELQREINRIQCVFFMLKAHPICMDAGVPYPCQLCQSRIALTAKLAALTEEFEAEQGALRAELVALKAEHMTPHIIDGYDVTFWHSSYGLLSEAVMSHLDQFVEDDDVAEEAIFVAAIEKAGAELVALKAERKTDAEETNAQTTSHTEMGTSEMAPGHLALGVGRSPIRENQASRGPGRTGVSGSGGHGACEPQSDAVAMLKAERHEFKALASVGPWHNDCRPNRKKAAEEIQKSQQRIDQLAADLATAHGQITRWQHDLEAWHLCHLHQPTTWESDGTCPICEAHQLSSELVSLKAERAKR